MTHFIEEFFSKVFGDNAFLATLLIAIIPIIELKGAIPFGASVDIWGGNALTLFQAYGGGLLGSSLVVPLLAALYIPLIKWLKNTKLFRKIALKIEEKINNKKTALEKKANKKKNSLILKYLGVFLFVAIPLPFTGVYTGTCLAVALGLGFFKSTVIVILGNCVAGLIVTLITHFFGNNSIIFVYIFIGLIVLISLFFVIKSIVCHIRKKKETNMEETNLQENQEKSDKNF